MALHGDHLPRVARHLGSAALLLASLVLAGCGSGRSAPAIRDAPSPRTDGAPVLALVGGRWFDGAAFVERTGYVTDGVLTFARPSRIDSTLDLQGGYVVPPFGEAHNHNVEPSARIDRTIARYLADGVFYVKNQNNLPGARDGLAGTVNVPTSIDVAFARGGLTGPAGHPIGVVQRNLDRGTWTAEDGEGAFYFTVADEAELVRKWTTIVEGHPDVLKTFLLYSDDYAQRQGRTEYAGWTGLDPALLPSIVRRAHAAGLRVSTHVETAVDFHHAVAAGVDEIAHLPGFRGDSSEQMPDPTIFEIADTDARRAAAAGVVVVTTAGGVREMDPAGPDSVRRRTFDRLHARNLRLLLSHGVALAIGSDDYGDTSLGEAMYLHALGVTDNLTMLKLWSEVTPRAIFPHRKIGCLDDGCEASFLVLQGDPIIEFRRVGDIVLRVKQGRVLMVPPGG